MARFFIGQRARVVRVRNVKSPEWRVGAEVLVVDNAEFGPDGDTADYVVRLDCGLFAYPMHEQLEPIIPNGGASEWTFQELMDRLRSGVAA